MISFPELGSRRLGRLGNQLFQYAFLRTTAERLGVQFFCPDWVGDEVFLLGDEHLRVPTPVELPRTFAPPLHDCGMVPEALEIEDGTAIEGFFQTQDYYPDPDVVRGWFRWRPELVESVRARSREIDFASGVSLHLRFGDKLYLRRLREMFYLVPGSYYARALSELGSKGPVFVFSDDPLLARLWLLPVLPRGLHFVRGNPASVDLMLMSWCRAHVCSPSSLSWWGAWLDPGPDRSVIGTAEGPFRPGSPFRNAEYWPREWKLLPAGRLSLWEEALGLLWRLRRKLYRIA